MRKIDFIHWGRSIGMRSMALGKRYVGVNFEQEGVRGRLYLFFVQPAEVADLELGEGRTALDSRIRELFERLKAIMKD